MIDFTPFALTKPVSITYFTPIIVSDVSAILVDKTIFLMPFCVGLKAFNCNTEGNPAYKGQISTVGSETKNK